jgi:hypothetical protein
VDELRLADPESLSSAGPGRFDRERSPQPERTREQSPKPLPWIASFSPKSSGGFPIKLLRRSQREQTLSRSGSLTAMPPMSDICPLAQKPFGRLGVEFAGVRFEPLFSNGKLLPNKMKTTIAMPLHRLQGSEPFQKWG